MSDVYEYCPQFENERWLLRLVRQEDAADLLAVYSDKNALPFFNSDNCDGDNFYYPTLERMRKAIDFWEYSYQYKWFVRLAIIDKNAGKAVGTIELFHRLSEDDFNHVGLIRIDLGSAYETAEVISEILALIIPPAYDLFDCTEIISKVPVYAIERQKAYTEYDFVKSDSFLVDSDDHFAYKDYWIVRK